MDKNVIKAKVDALFSVLDERARRLWAATEAEAIGWGGITLVAEATGMSPTTIRAVILENRARALALGHAGKSLKPGRLRASGGIPTQMISFSLGAHRAPPGGKHDKHETISAAVARVGDPRLQRHND